MRNHCTHRGRFVYPATMDPVALCAFVPAPPSTEGVIKKSRQRLINLQQLMEIKRGVEKMNKWYFDCVLIVGRGSVLFLTSPGAK